MKRKVAFTLVLILSVLTALALCGCRDEALELSNTVWKQGDNVTVYFYGDGTGKLDTDGLTLPFEYTLDGTVLFVECTDKPLSEYLGLDSISLFGENTVTYRDGCLYIADWEMTKTK